MRASPLLLRVRRIRSRAAVRAWEYRQRRHSKGTWYRLRRVLADSRACWVVPEDEAQRLIDEGHLPEPAGHQLQPPKNIFRLSAERIEAIPDRKQIRVGLHSELLAASCLVLEPFP